MARRFLVDQFSSDSWERWCKAFPTANLYQTWVFGETHCHGFGRAVSRAVLLDDNRPLALAQFRIKRIPFLRLGVAEANWGPLWDESKVLADERIAADFLAAVKNEYVTRRELSLQFELPGRADENLTPKLGAIFASNAFTPRSNERAYRTTMLNLGEGLEELRAKLHGKWRNSLNNAEKAGLEPEYGCSVGHFDRFRRLYDEMWAQKKFPTGVRMAAIRAYQERATETNKLRIWIIKDQGEDIAAGVFSALGDTIMYFLGASSPKGRKNANPGYLLQWLNVRKSVEEGFRWYDLGGLTDIPGSPVDLFKVRMGGARVMFPGWFECSKQTSRQRLYEVLERGYRRVFGRLLNR